MSLLIGAAILVIAAVLLVVVAVLPTLRGDDMTTNDQSPKTTGVQEAASHNLDDAEAYGLDVAAEADETIAAVDAVDAIDNPDELDASAVPPAPAATTYPAIPTNNPYPTLTAENLFVEKTPLRYNVNAWNAASYKGDFEIGGTKYYSGIGLFLTKSQISNKYGKDEVVYRIPEGYDTISFIIGPDSYWGYSQAAGESRITILGDDKTIYDTGWFDLSFQDTASLAIGEYKTLTIILEQTTGTKGTLNIVLGDFFVTREG